MRTVLFLIAAVMALTTTGAAQVLAATPAPNGMILGREALPTEQPSLFKIQRIVYSSHGLRIHAYLAEPLSAGPHPAIIYNRGGNDSFGLLSDGCAPMLLGPFAQQGYVTVASQYRGADGSEGRDEFGGHDVDDVLSLIPLLDSLAEVDSSRIGMIGYSRGGMMTYLALMLTKRIRAAVVVGAPTDLTEDIRKRPEMLRVYRRMITPDRRKLAAALRARSALFFAARLPVHTPILILQGTADWRTDPHQALDMARAMLDAQRPFRLIMLEGWS